MDLGIRNRVALVAASSRGLGREVARRLAEEGARLCLCARGADALRETAAWLREQFQADVLEVACDLTVESEVRALAHKAQARFGTVDILVANSGGPPTGSFLEHDDERWKMAVDLNLFSTVRLCREVIPMMTKNHWGRIVLMTSIAVKQPLDGLILSNSVRAAVIGLGKTLASELGPQGILVNSVCPGYFLTDRVRDLARASAQKTGGNPEDLLERFARSSPLGRVGDPQEFGSLVAFLCSERASFITGSTLAIDGGFCRSLM